MKKILIFGGAGFIGSNLTKSLVDADKEIIVFDRKKAHWENLIPFIDKIEIVKGDFDNFEILEKIFSENQIEIVVHLVSSAVPSTQIDAIIENNELIFTMRLIDMMIKNKVNKIIYFSSGGVVYGINGEEKNKEDSPTKPITIYGWMKVTLENYIQMCARTNKLDYIILRVSNVYGKNQNTLGKLGLVAVTVGKILNHKPMEVWGNGKVVRDYIHIDDVSKAILMLIKNNKWGNIYNVGSGKGNTVNNVLRMIKSISGIDFPITYKEARGVDIPINILDISKLKTDVPLFKPISLKEGIKNFWVNQKK